MLKKLRKGEYVFIKNPNLNLKNTSLMDFLCIPRLGVYVGDRVLVDVHCHYPRDRKKNDSALIGVIFELARLRFASLGKHSLEEFKQIHLHTDGKGRFSYLSLPKEWVIIKEHRLVPKRA